MQNQLHKSGQSINSNKVASVLLIATLIIGSKLKAQELPTIQTDRPDQTEGPYLVPAKHFQFESGVNYESVDGNTINMLYPTVLWKYGVNSNFEFRLITELAHAENDISKSIGLNPVMIGMKMLLVAGRNNIPQVSLIGHMSLPKVASPDFASTYFAPSFRFTIQHSLTEKISLGYNLGAQWDSETAVPTFIYTLVTGFSLAEKIGAYIEAYGFALQHSFPDHRVDGGFTFFPKSNIQFDISGGIGLTSNAPDFYGSLGFSMRLPN